jgi:hypothetical protein
VGRCSVSHSHPHLRLHTQDHHILNLAPETTRAHTLEPWTHAADDHVMVGFSMCCEADDRVVDGATWGCGQGLEASNAEGDEEGRGVVRQDGQQALAVRPHEHRGTDT